MCDWGEHFECWVEKHYLGTSLFTTYLQMELKVHDCYMENDSHFGNTPESEDFFFLFDNFCTKLIAFRGTTPEHIKAYILDSFCFSQLVAFFVSIFYVCI